jgi:hypothetical protein
MNKGKLDYINKWGRMQRINSLDWEVISIFFFFEKKLLFCFIDPIISLDSSSDGKWLLATCKTYLILLPTFYENVDCYK